MRSLGSLVPALVVLISPLCPAPKQRGQLLRVDVEIWTVPEGAAAYFIPSHYYKSEMLADSSQLRPYRVGSTNSTINLRELSYVAVFTLGSQQEVLYDVQVVFGQSNRVGIRFPPPPP